MCTKENDSILQIAVRVVGWLLLITILLNISSITVLVSTGKTEVSGKVYEFDKDSVDSWHLADDKSKKMGDLTLDSNILKGVFNLKQRRFLIV